VFKLIFFHRKPRPAPASIKRIRAIRAKEADISKKIEETAKKTMGLGPASVKATFYKARERKLDLLAHNAMSLRLQRQYYGNLRAIRALAEFEVRQVKAEEEEAVRQPTREESNVTEEVVHNDEPQVVHNEPEEGNSDGLQVSPTEVEAVEGGAVLADGLMDGQLQVGQQPNSLKWRKCRRARNTLATFTTSKRTNNTAASTRSRRTDICNGSLKVVHDGRPYKCTGCDRVGCSSSFVTREGLRVHVSNGRKKNCPQCDAKVSQQCMKKHMDSKHSDDRPFVCPICQKKFKLQQHVKRHVQRHA
jgi:hypothetical protein